MIFDLYTDVSQTKWHKQSDASFFDIVYVITYSDFSKINSIPFNLLTFKKIFSFFIEYSTQRLENGLLG